jgi:metal-sulfur cluster biosynthetic enzyme
MTLTMPNCPEAQYLPGAVKSAVETVPEVKEAEVQITWEPKWDREMMSDAAKLQLGML